MADGKTFENGKLAEAHAKALELHGRQTEMVKFDAAYADSANFIHLIGQPAGYVAPADKGPELKTPGKSR